MGKEPACNARETRDMGSVPGWGRYPEGEQGNPLQYSCLENPMDRGAWKAIVSCKELHRVAKSQSQLKGLSIHARVGSGVVS